MKKSRKSKPSWGISVGKLAFIAIPVLSFIVQLINVKFQSRIFFVVLITLVTVLYVASIRTFRIRVSLNYKNLIVLMVLAIAYATMRGARTVNNFSDLIVITLLSIFVFSVRPSTKSFMDAVYVIRAFSIFYSISVWIQIIMPGIYSSLIRLLYDSSVRDSVLLLQKSGYISGFATNVGFTAGYICSGLFAIVAMLMNSKVKYGKTMLAFLAVSLIFTGKRGHVLFALLSVFFLYIISIEKREVIKKYSQIFAVVLVVVLAFVCFGDVLVTIPSIGRVVESINGLLLGEDISNGRTNLRLWAMAQFAKHPFVGIGWGEARIQSFGAIVFTKQMDMHNVFVQLLCETGILGFVPVCAVFAIFFIKSIQHKRDIVCRRSVQVDIRWKVLLDYSLVYQCFFLLYCFSGNPLYDQAFQIMYFFSLAIIAGYERYQKKVMLYVKHIKHTQGKYA